MNSVMIQFLLQHRDVSLQRCHLRLVSFNNLLLLMNLRIDHSEVVELRFHVALRGVEQLFRISNLFFQCCALLLQTFNALAALS